MCLKVKPEIANSKVFIPKAFHRTLVKEDH